MSGSVLVFSKWGSIVPKVWHPKINAEAKVGVKDNHKSDNEITLSVYKLRELGADLVMFIAAFWMSYFPFGISILQTAMCQRSFS